ncbi:MAG: hypothetical protein HYY24_09420 [Verrucomicrobia bacterium]|nr:hypothetical protein [Verrucomicrobiota bacterium]
MPHDQTSKPLARPRAAQRLASSRRGLLTLAAAGYAVASSFAQSPADARLDGIEQNAVAFAPEPSADPASREMPRQPEVVSGQAGQRSLAGDRVSAPTAAGSVRVAGGAEPPPPCAGLSEPLLLSSTGGYLPDMAIDRFGRAHVVWQGEDRFVWYAQVGPDGQITFPARKIYGNVATAFPRIAVDSAGDAHVVTTRTGTLLGSIIYLKVSNGERVLLKVFSMFRPIGPLDSEQYDWASIDINPVTQLPVVAAEEHSSSTDVTDPFPVTRFNSYISVISLDAAGNPDRSSRWTAYFLQNASAPDYRAEFPSVAVDSLGGIHCVWQHRDPEAAGAIIGYARAGGASWEQTSNAENIANLVGRPRIARNDIDGVEIVWSTTSGAVVWQEKDHAGLTSLDDFVVSQPAAQANRASVAAGYGNVFFSWADQRDGAGFRIFGRNLLNPAPEHNLSCNVEPAFNHALVARDRDLVAIAWQENRDGLSQIFYRSQPPIELVALEAIQTIQDWNNSVPLIEDKTTFVRAHVQLSGVNTNVLRVEGAQLRGFRESKELPDSPLAAYSPGFVLASTNAAELRGVFTNSLNFSLPATWLKGTVDLRFEWTNGVACREPAETGGVASNCVARVRFESVATPEVRFVSVSYVDAVGTTNAASVSEMDDLALRLQSIYPIAKPDWTTTEMTWPRTGPPSVTDVTPALRWRRWLEFCFSLLGCDRIYYGVIKGDAPPDGYLGLALDIPSPVASGYLRSNPFIPGRHTHSHEIGHCLGRHHSVTSKKIDCLDDDLKPTTCLVGVCNEVASGTAPVFPYFSADNARPTLGPMPIDEHGLIFGLDTLVLEQTSTNPDHRSKLVLRPHELLQGSSI